MHPTAQLAFAERMGVEVVAGDPAPEVPGRRIVIPERPEQIRALHVDLERLKRSYIVKAAEQACSRPLTEAEVAFLAADTRMPAAQVARVLAGE